MQTQETTMTKWKIALFLTLALGVSCQAPSGAGDDATLDGKASPARTEIRALPSRTEKTLQDVAQTLLSLRVNQAAPLRGLKSSARSSLARSYLTAMQQVQGIPRHQGEALLRSMVSPQSTACEGKSCARVFDIENQDVDDFMNFLLQTTATAKVPETPAGHAQRAIAVHALAPIAAFGSPQKPWDFIAKLYLRKPRGLPAPLPQPVNIVSFDLAESTVGYRFLEAIYNYTGNEFGRMRHIEGHADGELLQEGYPIDVIQGFRRQTAAINAGLAKLPQVRQTVFRGLTKVSQNDVAFWVKSWQSKAPISLGPNHKPALTSASWKRSIAERFLQKESNWKNTERFSVLMEIHDHQGVGVENISAIPPEAEVLIPTKQKFVIEDMAPLLHEPQILILILKGIQSAHVFFAQTPWVARAA